MGNPTRHHLPGLLVIAAAVWTGPAAADWFEGPLDAEDASLVGASPGDWSGASLAALEDVDGDGQGDLLVGARMADPEEAAEGSDAGLVYLLRGPLAALEVSLAGADVVFQGEANGDHLGHAVAALGDLDGDGRGEFLMSAPDHRHSEFSGGKVYLFLGDEKWGEGVGTLSVADATASFVGQGAEDQAGYALAGLGDLDGDERPDFAIGAPGARVEEGADQGRVYVVPADGMMAGHEVSLGGPFVRLAGEEPGDQAGYALDGGEDVDGDGLMDFLVGAPGSNFAGDNAGRTYLVLGDDEFVQWWDEDTPLPEVAHTSFHGAGSGLRSGEAVALVGDADGDGRSELAIGAPFAFGEGEDGAEVRLGVVYLFRSDFDGWIDAMTLGFADAEFRGDSAGDLAGSALAGVGDVNADGLDDLVIGAYGSDRHANAAGTAYLVLGQAGGPGTGGPLREEAIALWGELANDHLGYAVAGGVDLGGGVDPDLVLGAPSNDQGGGTNADPWDGAGKTYVVHGAPCWDQDGDTYASSECGGSDCDDGDEEVHPGANEFCVDGVDNDCDGDIDDEDSDCTGDDDGGDDDAGDDDDAAADDGHYGGGGLICGKGEVRQSLVLPLALLLGTLGLRRRAARR